MLFGTNCAKKKNGTNQSRLVESDCGAAATSNAANPSGVCGAQANGRLRDLATGGGVHV